MYVVKKPSVSGPAVIGCNMYDVLFLLVFFRVSLQLRTVRKKSSLVIILLGSTCQDFGSVSCRVADFSMSEIFSRSSTKPTACT